MTRLTPPEARRRLGLADVAEPAPPDERPSTALQLVAILAAGVLLLAFVGWAVNLVNQIDDARARIELLELTCGYREGAP